MLKDALVGCLVTIVRKQIIFIDSAYLGLSLAEVHAFKLSQVHMLHMFFQYYILMLL